MQWSAIRSLANGRNVDRNIDRTLVLALVGAILYLLCGTLQPIESDPDARTYLEPGLHLLNGRGFEAQDHISYVGPARADAPTAPETFRTPLYPIVFAAAAQSGALRLLIVAQHAALLLVAGMIFLHVRSRRSVREAYAATTLFVLFARWLDIAARTSPEALLTLFVALGVFQLMRVRESGRAAVALGAGTALLAAALTKPVAVYVGAALIVTTLITLRRRRVALTLLMTALPLVGVALWTARNARVSGIATFSSVTGENLYYWRAAGIEATLHHGVWFCASALQRESDFYRTLRATQLRYQRRVSQLPLTNHAQRMAHVAPEARAIILRSPLRALLLTFSGARILLLDWPWDAAASRGFEARNAERLFVPLMALLLAGALYGTVQQWREERGDALLISVAWMGFIALSSGPESVGRFFLVASPWYCIVAVRGLFAALSLRKTRRGGLASASSSLQ